MDVLTAKKLVIAAGERLVETGLIARTWGNVIKAQSQINK